MMRVGDETAALSPGDLVRIPPNEIHSIWPIGGSAIEALAVGFSYMLADRVGYTIHPTDGSAPRWVPHAAKGDARALDQRPVRSKTNT
jgi:AraC-like ligand binding domain